MAALGASLRAIGASSGARPRSCSRPRSLLAAVLGWLLAEMLVAMLQHVSTRRPTTSPSPGDTSPASAAPPSPAGLLAAALAALQIRRLPLGAILREQ